jgi:hypothetical protein
MRYYNSLAYYIPNNQSKRVSMFACPQGGQQCIINSLFGVSDTSTDASSSSNVNIVYSDNYCPFVIPETIPSGVLPKNYEIVISGSNTTSFGNCNPTTTLTVNCTGLFSGIFPGNQIDTTSYNSAAVNDVQIYTGMSSTSGLPNPLVLEFNTSTYSNGVCTIQIETKMAGITTSNNTYNLIKQYSLSAIDWTWNPSTNSWYSMIQISAPTKSESGYNVKLQLNFTLNNSTNSNKNQTWMQMDAKLAYSSGEVCPDSDEATVSGKMKSITEVYN